MRDDASDSCGDAAGKAEVTGHSFGSRNDWGVNFRARTLRWDKAPAFVEADVCLLSSDTEAGPGSAMVPLMANSRLACILRRAGSDEKIQVVTDDSQQAWHAGLSGFALRPTKGAIFVHYRTLPSFPLRNIILKVCPFPNTVSISNRYRTLKVKTNS